MIVSSKNNHAVNLDKVCFIEKFTKNPNVSGGTPSIQFHFTETFSEVWTFDTEAERNKIYLNLIDKNNENSSCF